LTIKGLRDLMALAHSLLGLRAGAMRLWPPKERRYCEENASMDTVKRTGLVAELKMAHEEAGRLDEMIRVLQVSRSLDEPRLRQLQIEKLTLNKKAIRLHKELRELDALAA
jgi:hypothetical protein